MKRKFYLVLLLALTPTFVNALGLGKLDLNSALNEPFDARIQLLSPTADELDSLNVALADNEAFERAKLDRPFILSKLKFALRRSVDDGPDYIRVYSSEPIREPFLNFLVEVSWSKGRLYREYTVLLDPPLYDPKARSSEFKQKLELVEQAEATIDDPDHKVVYAEDFDQSTSTTTSVTSPTINYGGGDYGPTSDSDTLWSIASAMRPDTSISVNQMMLALLRTNPDAFFNQNINGLKRGQILRMPTESEINALSNAEALAEVQSQYAVWDGVKDNFSSTVSERAEVSSTPTAESTDVEETSSVADVTVDSDPELKLVAANDTDEVTEQAASVDGGSGQDLVLAQESIQALTQENIELKDRLQESETLLSDLKRLLELKDDELAALQSQMSGEEAVAMPEEEVVVEEEPVEEAEEELVDEEEPVVEEKVVEAVVEDEAEVVEEEPVEEAEEESVVEEEPVAEEEATLEDEAVVEEEVAAEEEIVEVIDEPAPVDGGIMGMVNQYIGPVKDLLLGNPIVLMAVGGILVLLIIVMVLMKLRKGRAETMHIDQTTEAAFPDFDSGDMGDTGGDVPDSEAVTVLPDSESEAETALHEPAEEPDLDLGMEEEEEKTQFVAQEEAPVEEEQEPEEDPLQEVNTYLAFEQFDQAEEMVKNAINDDPDNPEYHTKLLEVFYTSGNKKGYEEAAKVLHDKFGEANENWGMAVAMWQEMSPNRALFEEGEDADDDDDSADTTGGFVDVTADEEAADAGDDGGLDFDIGGAEEAPAEEAAAPAEDGDDVLDLTASDEGEDLLDVTAAVGLDEADTASDTNAEDDVLDISGSSAGAEDLLDVTAAVGLDESDTTSDVSAEDDLLDISGTSTGADDLLDVTAATDGGEDLLDVTAAGGELDLDADEDLLDVTAATSAGADSAELLDIEPEETEKIDAAEAGASDDDNVIDFDLATGGDEVASEEETIDRADEGTMELDMDALGSSDDEDPIRLDVEDSIDADADSGSDDISLDFDMGDAATDSDSSDDGEIALDIEATDDAISLDMDAADTSDEGEISLDMDVPDTADEADDISLDMDSAGDTDIELDLSAADDESAADLEISLDDAAEEPVVEDDGADMDFDLSLDMDDDASAESSDIDLDGTVEMPKLDVADDDDDDDDEDSTVFVPRSAQPDEQSAEDEVATKLDLAKAYVELGDKDSAKTILDEVMAEGNDDQKKQAEELLAQV